MIRYIKKEKLTWPSPRKKNPSLSRKIIYIYTVFHAISFAHNSLKCWSSFLWEKWPIFVTKSQFAKKNHMTQKLQEEQKKILLLLLQRILLNNFLGGLSQSPLDYDGHFFECLEYFCKNYEKRKKEIIFAFCCPPTISPPLL